MSQLRQAVTSHSLFTPTRLYSLYSDFKKLKEINPEGYEANIIAWRSLFAQFLNDGLLSHSFIIDTETLVHDLTLSNYGKPLSLATVFEEFISDGELMPLTQFMNSEGVYLTKWVRPALNWVIKNYIYDTSFKMSDRKGELKMEKLVSLKSLERFKNLLQEKLESQGNKSDRLFTKSQFKAYLGSLSLVKGVMTDLDIEVLLRYLQRDTKQLTVMNDVVKFGSEEITESDQAILEIKSTITTLSEQNEILEEKIHKTIRKLKQVISSPTHNKDLAKNLLKSKKLAETSLSKQISSLNQLESILFKINEAKTNLEVINSIKSSTQVLSSLNSQMGDVEAVEAVIDELQRETAKIDTTSQALADLNLNEQVDDDEIEDEFERMLMEELSKEKVSNNKRKDQGLELVSKENDGDVFEDATDNIDTVSERFKNLKLIPSEIKRDEEEVLKKEEDLEAIAN